MKTKIINLTPHNIYMKGKYVLPKADKPCRVKVEKNPISYIDISSYAGLENEMMPVYKTEYSKNVENLPEPEIDKVYIVSRIVREAVPERKDLLVPEDLIRDDEGNIIGCNSFSL